MLTCLSGTSTETPLSEIVAHLTAKRDNVSRQYYCQLVALIEN